jgi:hypothetical protein
LTSLRKETDGSAHEEKRHPIADEKAILDSLVKILLSLIIYISFFLITNTPAYAITTFSDNFSRADGTVGNGWVGSSWAIRGNSLVYSPSLTERVTNPGAEGLFTKRFLVRDYSSGDIVVNSAMTYVPSPAKAFNNQMGTGPGIIVNLDDPNNPQNYVIAYYDGTHLRLSKFVSGVETNLINILESAPDGDLVEICKNDTIYQMFTHGNQVGTDQTISDAAILAGSYVGLYGIENSATKFSVFTSRPYGTVYASTKSTGSFTNATAPSGKCVLSLRFDDNNANDYSFVYPLLHTRGLVGGFAIVRNGISYGGNDTLANIKAMQANGMEIMAHSYTHSSDPRIYKTFENETALAVEEMRLIGLNVDSFVQPGTWTGTYYPLINSTSFFRTPESALIRIYYNAFEGYIWGPIRNLPITGNYRYGANHETCDQMSLADIEKIVDSCIKNHKGLEILFHSDSIGQPKHISKEDFTLFLDYIQKKVNTSQLIVLTPTQQLFAHNSDSRR